MAPLEQKDVAFATDLARRLQIWLYQPLSDEWLRACADARTLSVSKHGGMMVLEPEVAIGQKLTLVNMNSAQKIECRVVSAKLMRDGKRNVAFEFTSTDINFWKMCFPAAGTKPTRRAVQSTFGALPATKMAQ